MYSKGITTYKDACVILSYCELICFISILENFACSVLLSFVATVPSIFLEGMRFHGQKTYDIWILSSVKIQDIQLFNDHLVVYERENGLPKVTIYGLPDVGEPLKSLQGGHLVEFIDPIYSVDPSESQFNSSILRFYYSSMKTPPSVYDYDMKTGVSVLKKIETVSYMNRSFSNYCVLNCHLIYMLITIDIVNFWVGL